MSTDSSLASGTKTVECNIHVLLMYIVSYVLATCFSLRLECVLTIITPTYIPQYYMFHSIVIKGIHFINKM